MSITIDIRTFTGLGDQLFVTPSLPVIRKAYPDARIVVKSVYPEIFYKNPCIDSLQLDLNNGTFVGYNYPGWSIRPDRHHILAVWKDLCDSYNLVTEKPSLQPELYFPLPLEKTREVLVQTLHVHQWHSKKVWDKFDFFAETYGYEPIPHVTGIYPLVKMIASARVVVCSEGAISHIAKAVGTKAVVIFGGWSNPEWNGYSEQTNITNVKDCSYCWNPDPCTNQTDRLCMREITLEQVQSEVERLLS